MMFFMEMKPPTSTGQMRKVRVVNGRPMFYEPPKVKEARDLLTAHLMKYTPDEPLVGPVSLRVEWYFPKGSKHKDMEWKATRPDTDNLEKLLKDCMTACGFWKDDSQVCREIIEKKYSSEPTGIYIEVIEL